jgi:hypothetical protein
MRSAGLYASVHLDVPRETKRKHRHPQQRNCFQGQSYFGQGGNDCSPFDRCNAFVVTTSPQWLTSILARRIAIKARVEFSNHPAVAEIQCYKHRRVRKPA